MLSHVSIMCQSGLFVCTLSGNCGAFIIQTFLSLRKSDSAILNS